jgi:rhodanese-related sulfurtransferase
MAVQVPIRPIVRDSSQVDHGSTATETRPRTVNGERRRAIAEFLEPHLGSRARISPRQLGVVTAAVAANRQLWQDLVVEDADQRWYMPLHLSPTCDVWLLAWLPSQDTDWHDHGGSSGSLCVADGVLLEHLRTVGGHQVRTRRLQACERAVFGPAHVHNVTHCGDKPAVSIHAYSPPLVAMTYYELTPAGLVASETVEVSSPEGPRREVGLLGPLRGVDGLVAHARLGIDRLSAKAAHRAVSAGATLVHIRPFEQRREEGEIPGAVVIGRNVLEWRLDPRSDTRIVELARYDAQIIVLCSEGYASSLPVASLRHLGLSGASDLEGGFRAWKAAGLPTRTL